MFKKIKKSKSLKYIIGITLIYFGLSFGFNQWLNSALPDILNKNPKRSYTIQYKDMDFSLLGKSLKIKEICVVPFNQNDSTKISIEGTVDEIEINGISFLKLLFKEVIVASDVAIKTPFIKLINNFEKNKLADKSKSIQSFWSDFYNSIQLKNVALTNGRFVVVSKITKAVYFESSDINLKIDNVFIDENTMDNKIPFYKDNLLLTIGKSKAYLKKYNASFSKIVVDTSSFKLNELELKPNMSFKAFNNSEPTEKLYYTTTFKELNLINDQLSFINDTLFVKAQKLEATNVSLSIRKDKRLPDDLSKKKLYGSLLRSLPFYTQIDSLIIKRSNIYYEEIFEDAKQFSKVDFDNIHVKASHITNYKYENDSIETIIDYESKLYGNANLAANMNFKTASQNDAYHLTGSLKNFELQNIESYSYPLLNVKVDGLVKAVYFDMNMNDYNGKATIKLGYKNLRVDFLNKKNKSNFLKNKAAKLLLDNNKKEIEYTTKKVEKDRDQSKSMYIHMIQTATKAARKIVML